jgi:hypothetical protein
MDHRDAKRLRGVCFVELLIHVVLIENKQRIRARDNAFVRFGGRMLSIAISFIRTVTVGSGISPDLLTPQSQGQSRALAGFRTTHFSLSRDYRRWGISPRPENAATEEVAESF